MLRIAFAAFVVCTSAATAAAQSDDEQARNHYLAGNSYYEQARYADSAREFEESYRLSQRPELLLNLSYAYERAGDIASAADRLERYLAAVPDAPNHMTLQTRLEQLRASVPAGATVAPTATAGASSGGGGMSGLMVGSLVLFGLAGAAAIVSIGTGVVAEDRYNQLALECGSGTCPGSLLGVRDEGAVLASVSTAFMFVGIGAAAAGLVMLLIDLTSGGSSEAAPASATAVSLRPGRGGAMLELSF